jgi:hypothetical protein
VVAGEILCLSASDQLPDERILHTPDLTRQGHEVGCQIPGFDGTGELLAGAAS